VPAPVVNNKATRLKHFRTTLGDNRDSVFDNCREHLAAQSLSKGESPTSDQQDWTSYQKVNEMDLSLLAII
jgi:hypothetical protein